MSGRSITQDMDDFIRYRAWLADPTVRISFERGQGRTYRLMITACSGLPDVEIDPSSELSVSFGRLPAGEPGEKDRYFLHTLCLGSHDLWGGDSDAAKVAAQLVGKKIGRTLDRATDSLSGGMVSLTKREAAGLVKVWTDFVARNS